jgi:hypothetical protein
MQRLLRYARGDADAVRGDSRAHAADRPRRRPERPADAHRTAPPAAAIRSRSRTRPTGADATRQQPDAATADDGPLTKAPASSGKLRGTGLVARMAKRGIVDDGTVTLSDFAPGQ